MPDVFGKIEVKQKGSKSCAVPIVLDR